MTETESLKAKLEYLHEAASRVILTYEHVISGHLGDCKCSWCALRHALAVTEQVTLAPEEP